MNYITRSCSVQRFSRTEGKWLSYRLKAAGKTHDDVAALAGVTPEMATMVLNGNRGSVRVYNALCTVLGYRSITALLNDVRRSVA